MRSKSFPQLAIATANKHPQDRHGPTDDAIAAERQRTIELLQSIDAPALANVARDIKEHECRLPALCIEDPSEMYEAVKGQIGKNLNLDVEFYDGDYWIARIPLANNPRMPPKQIQDYILRNEAATLKYLGHATRLPSPRIFAISCAPNEVGVSYSLIEKLPGTALMPDWPPYEATAEQQQKLLEQLADVYIELSANDFPATGAVVSAKDRLDRDELRGVAHINAFEDAEGDSPGPWASTVSAMLASSRSHLKLIRRGELPDHPVDNYLRHLWRIDLLTEHPLLIEPTTKWYLRHRDDKGDHILVDSEFNITGIIDWEFASIEHPGIAFSSPRMLWPREKFYAGSQELSQAELEFAKIFEWKGYPELAGFVLNGRLMQRLDFDMIEYPCDFEEYIMLVQGARKAVSLAQTGSEDVSSYVTWMEEMFLKHADDQGLKDILHWARSPAADPPSMSIE